MGQFYSALIPVWAQESSGKEPFVLRITGFWQETTPLSSFKRERFLFIWISSVLSIGRFFRVCRFIVDDCFNFCMQSRSCLHHKYPHVWPGQAAHICSNHKYLRCMAWQPETYDGREKRDPREVTRHLPGDINHFLDK